MFELWESEIYFLLSNNLYICNEHEKNSFYILFADLVVLIFPIIQKSIPAVNIKYM